jgi:hypothetical protein
MSTSAADLRHTLRILFQPTIAENPEMWRRVSVTTAANLAADGITERRLRNAAEQVSVPSDLFEDLVRMVNLLREQA